MVAALREGITGTCKAAREPNQDTGEDDDEKDATGFYPDRIDDRGRDHRYLAAVAIPAYNTYTLKARFSEVIDATNPFKIGIEECYLRMTNLTNCDTGQNGVPAAATDNGSFVASVNVSNNAATTAQIDALANTNGGLNGQSYRMDANVVGGRLVWTFDAPNSDCDDAGIC